MNYLKLVFIRHAQSLGNLQQQMEGQSSTPLSPAGQHQALCLAQRLAQHDRPSHFYSSPLLRATQTADIIVKALPSTHIALHHRPSGYQLTKALQEMHQGIFQGLTWPQAQARYPDTCQQLMTTLSWQPVPQAESLEDARYRAIAWVDHLLQVHSPGDVVWALSHEGILQQIISALLRCELTWKISIGHTALFEFWLAGHPEHISGPDQFNTEYWHIHRFNDCQHLARIGH